MEAGASSLNTHLNKYHLNMLTATAMPTKPIRPDYSQEITYFLELHGPQITSMVYR